MKLFNHIQIKVKDFERSRKFYDLVLGALGYKVVLSIDEVVIGYGTSIHDMFEIRQSDSEAPLSSHVHVAFNAPSKEAVEEFYQCALGGGGTCNGAPGLRPEYEEGYYAAFVIDPEGHNIEAVFCEMAKGSVSK